MQEENVTVSDAFLFQLGTLLTAHDRPVPFAMPRQMAPPAPRQDRDERRAQVPAAETVVVRKKVVVSRASAMTFL